MWVLSDGQATKKVAWPSLVYLLANFQNRISLDAGID